MTARDAQADGRLARVLREAAAPGVLEALATRLSRTDLQTLLLEVYRRRAAAVTPSRLLDQYERNRFTSPSPLDPAELARLDVLMYERLARHGFDAVALSPVCPLGTNAAVATVDQNKVLTTSRNTEVVADASNALALECAVRRRRLPREDRHRRIRLGASHRVVRAQAFDGPGMTAHFQLLALCTAGRDEGTFAFETGALTEQIGVHLDILECARDVPAPRVTVTDLSGGRHRETLRDRVLDVLAPRHPAATFGFDDDRPHGRGYYVDACFEISGLAEKRHTLVDGGFTRWTADLLGNAKERLLISGLGVELMCALFPAAAKDA